MSCNLWDDIDDLQCWPISASAYYAAHAPAAQHFNPAFVSPLHSSPYHYNTAQIFGWPQHSHPTIKGHCPPPVMTSSHSTYSSHAAPSIVAVDHDTVLCQQSSRFVENYQTSCTHCKTTPYAVAKKLNDIVTMPPQEFLKHMKDRDACNFLIQHFPRSPTLRSALNALLINPVVLIRLSMDGHGNYFVQKAIEEAGPMTRTLFNIFSECMLRLTCNRYGCRVVQKVIECFPIEMAFEIVAKYHGDELTISLDPNACHVIQKVIACHGPEVFEPFVTAYTECIQNFDHVVLNKYGCHVIQKVLEKLVTYMPGTMNASNSLAAKLLLDVVGRIKEKAHVYVFAEFANYVVQFVLVTPSLVAHARYIIENVVVPKARALAMDKFGSNVLEKALKVSPTKSFNAICQELFEGSQKSTSSTMHHEDPLGELIFHKYGNYVMQTLLEESSHIVSGLKQGDPQWFFLLEKRIRKSQERLAGFSSGKRLLQILKMTCRNHNARGNRPPPK